MGPGQTGTSCSASALPGDNKTAHINPLNRLSLDLTAPDITKGAISVCNFKDICDFMVSDLNLCSWEAT